MARTVLDAEAHVLVRPPTPREGEPERPDAQLVDPDREHLPGPRVADGDRADQRVPLVELRVAGLEQLPVATVR